jgi:predicted ATP-grasp superfamily ATP-dependent carboligase
LNGPSALNLFDKPKLQNGTLIIGWAEDASNLSMRTTDYLIRDLGCAEIGEILPLEFFPLAGVSVENDVAQFPQSKFYASRQHNLVVFQSNIPRMEWYGFLNILLDVAQECGVREIYTLGAMVSASAHTMPRQLITVINSGTIKAELEPFNVMADADYETPLGQKPTMSTYLLWLARQRGIDAVNLWVPVPYYLVPVDDPRACKRLVYFFNSKYDLGIDFRALDSEITEQNRRIAELFDRSPDIEALIRRLETGEGIDGAESDKLAREILEYLKQ